MNNNKSAGIFITVLSVAIPGLVALMLFSSFKISSELPWLKSLPGFNATINGTTAMLLILGKFFAKKGEVKIHKILMTLSLSLGVIFLLSYVLYHSTTPSAIFGDANLNGVLESGEKAEIAGLRYFYLGVLLSHILLSIVVVPFVLRAFYFALSGAIEKHVKVVKYTWPIWLYVSVTGVIVYLLASPYYPE